MIVSLYDSARDNVPKRRELTWEAFAASLGPHDFTRKTKLLLPAWSPAEYAAGDTRANENVIAIHALALDLDGVTEAEAMRACSTFPDHGLAGIVHTSWSHADDPWRLRLIAPFARPVEPDEWESVWAAANELFGGMADPQRKDPAGIYFGAFAPPGTEDHHFFETFPGAFLDPDELGGTGSPGKPAPPAGGSEPLSHDRLLSFAKALRRKTDDYLSHVGATLIKVCDGEPFAESGDRDNTIFRLSCVIAKRFPDADPASVAAHFTSSIEKMGTDCPDVSVVEYKIRRQQESIREERAAQARQEAELHATRIREAFGNGREEPYTQDELEAFGPNIAKRWVIQRGRTFYLFRAGSYVGPYSDADVLNAAIRDLSPASSAGVELFRVDRRGNVSRRAINDLVERYGTVAESVRLDLLAQATVYDEDTRSIVEAPCPRRELRAVHHEPIAKWLELMAGDRLPELLTWLAALVRLDRPCVVLFLTGPPGTGKTLLPMGSSRIWTIDQPTPLEDLLGPFNSAIAHCPLVLGDEQLPKDFRGFSKTAELRQAVQATVRPYREKYRPTATLHGAIRIVITANNEEILATPENLAANDIAAIIDRYLHVPTSRDAAVYLRNTDTSGWVERDMIAEHVLWLAENHEWTARGRFVIETQDAALHRSLTTRSGNRSAVCQWLCSYLLNPAPFDNDGRSAKLVRIHEGRLLANTQGLVSCWGIYVQNEACPPTGRMSSAIASLSTERRLRLHGEAGKPRINYREIDVENLVAWAEETGYASREDLEQALTQATEERAPHLAPN